METQKEGLPLATRCFLCLLISVGYVLGLYALTPTYSRGYSRSREDSAHIRQRLAAASVLTILVVLALRHCYEWIKVGTVMEQVAFSSAFGFRLDTAARSCEVAVVLMSVFYGGPIATKLVFWCTCIIYEVQNDGRCERRKGSLLSFDSFPGLLGSWRLGCLRAFYRLAGSPATIYIPLRSLVFAPISEEIVFRAAFVVILYPDLRELSIWIAPLLFAPAHLHHGIQKVPSEKADYVIGFSPRHPLFKPRPHIAQNSTALAHQRRKFLWNLASSSSTRTFLAPSQHFFSFALATS